MNNWCFTVEILGVHVCTEFKQKSQALERLLLVSIAFDTRVNGAASKPLIGVVGTGPAPEETFKDVRGALPSCHMDWMDIPSAATHRRPMLQGLGSEAVEVPCKVFQQAFTLMVELGEKLHIVFSNRLEENLKWGQVPSCADASDQLHIAALNGLT